MFKYYSIVLLISILSPALAKSQVSAEPQTMSLGVQYGFTIEIQDTDCKIITSEWKDYLKEYGKVKRNRKAKEYFIMDEQIPSIHGADKMDIYMKCENEQMTVFIDLGDQFLDAEHDDYVNVEDFLIEFSYAVQRSKINTELAKEQKVLKKLDRKQSSLEKDHKRYLRNIESAKKKIVENENNLKKNKSNQEDMLKQIKDQKSFLKEVQERLNGVGSRQE